jgi:hypothetical protein
MNTNKPKRIKPRSTVAQGVRMGTRAHKPLKGAGSYKRLRGIKCKAAHE